MNMNIMFLGLPMKLDLHAHTFYSDSFFSPESVVKMAIKRKLGGLAITDHNELAGALRAKEYAKRKGILLIPGEEIGTNKGEVIGLFLHKKICKGTFEDVIEKIRGQGGIVVFPHPCDRLRKGVLRDQGLAKFADAIETFNSRVIFQEDNAKAGEIAKKHKKAVTGGSDAHFTFEIGAGWTEFSGETEEDFRKAIRLRKTKSGGKASPPLVHGLGKVALFINRFRR
jgi:predicted metal-dependent phosphoesterase TrpH